MKTGKTFWTRANWRREIRASVVLPATAQSFESIWNELFTTNASAVIRGFRKKRKRQAHDFVDNVILKNKRLQGVKDPRSRVIKKQTLEPLNPRTLESLLIHFNVSNLEGENDCRRKKTV
jgi:hypothetical protein